MLFFMSINSLQAQNSSSEFWPETDIWYRFNHSWRLSTFIPLALYNNDDPTDMNVYLQADYAFGTSKRFVFAKLVNENRAQLMKTWLARAGVMHGWSIEEGGNYQEDLIYSEIHNRLPIGNKVLHSFRLRHEMRWLGEDNVFSYRIRCRMMLEKEFTHGKLSMTPYFNVEPYYDSRYSTINRVRLIGGTTLSTGPRLALEGNLTYQYDEHYYTPNMYAVNVILHVFLESKHAKPQPLEDQAPDEH
jgi:hypothetical protein